MAHLGTPQSVVWGACVFAQLALVALLFLRRSHRAFPFFTAYILLCIGQSAVLFPIYLSRGYSSPVAWRTAWISQGLVILARGIAVAEICRKILRSYRGIWGLASRLLAACAAAITIYSFYAYAASSKMNRAIPAADRGLELAIAAVIVLLFVFARYYRLPVPNPERAIVVGFCFYSCVHVLNYTVLDRFLYGYWEMWNLLASLASFASLFLWIWTLRAPLLQRTEEPSLVASMVYNQLSPEINHRLRMLNEQLLAFWRTKVPHL